MSSNAAPKVGEKRRHDEGGVSGAHPCADQALEEDDVDWWKDLFSAMHDTKQDIYNRLSMVVDNVRECDLKCGSYDEGTGSGIFFSLVNSYGNFAPEKKWDRRFEPTALEKCIRFVECQALLNAFEMGGNQALSCVGTDEVAIRAYCAALQGGGSVRRKAFTDCPIAKELKGKPDYVFCKVTYCLQNVVHGSRPVIDLRTCDADLCESEGDEKEDAVVVSGNGDRAAGAREEQTALVTEHSSPTFQSGVAGAVGGLEGAPAEAAVDAAMQAPVGSVMERDTSSGALDVPMATTAGGATSSEAAPQGTTSNTTGPTGEQRRSTESSARKRKSGAKRRNERKQRERVAGAGAAAGAAETSSASSSGSLEGSPESGGAASGKAAHKGATSKPTAPVLQSSSKQNAWSGGIRSQNQRQPEYKAATRAAATHRFRGPGPVYRFVGERVPAAAPIATGTAVRSPSVAPSAGGVGGGAQALAAGSTVASQVTFLILSVISALQGILVQSAGTASGGEGVSVVVEGL